VVNAITEEEEKKRTDVCTQRKKNETNVPRLCPTPVLAIYDATNMRDDQIFIIII
jgi:hypothetical protein